MGHVLATVLFTDMVDSTALRAEVGDAAADVLVDVHDTIFRRVVEGLGGTVVKFLGDGGLATFPSTHDAMSAAGRIQRAVSESDRPGLRVRAGVHAGEVVSTGGDIAGMPVVVASRLCSMAGPGEIVVSDVVRDLLGSRSPVELLPLGPLSLKGVPAPVDAWITPSGDSGSDRTRRDGVVPFPANLGHRSIRWIGRQDEIDQLDQVFAGLDRQYLVAVSGEPGIGKTAIVARWASRIHEAGVTVIAGGAFPEGGAPYQPIVEMLRPLLEHHPSVAPHGAGAANLARILPEVGVSARNAPVSDDPQTERYLINEAAFEILANATDAVGPLVAVLDDLHWADEASLSALSHALRHARAIPVLFVATYRDTELSRRHPLAAALQAHRRDRRAERIDLSGLTDDDVAALVASVAGAEPPSEALEAILAETQGNPFFVEEIVEHLTCEGVVRDGRWTFERGDRIAIPEGIRDTIGRRLDRLPEFAQELLAVGSVLGASFDPESLARAIEDPLDGIEPSLQSILDAGLLVERSDGMLAFSHALIRQTVYEEMSHMRRSRLHRVVGGVLAESGAPPGMLVHHWLQGRVNDRALQSAVEAVRAAEQVAAHSSVIEYSATALELWDEVEEGRRPPGVARHDIITSAGMAHGVGTGSGEGVDFVRRHRATMDPATDPVGVGALMTEEARHLWPLGRVVEAKELAEEAVALIPAAPPSRERARALAQLARVQMLSGYDAARARHLAAEALEAARIVGDEMTETASLLTLGTVAPDPVESETLLREGLERAERLNAAFQITRARSNLAELLAAQGRLVEAEAVMAAGLQSADRLGLGGQALEWMKVNHAEKLGLADRWDEMLERLDTPMAFGYPAAMGLEMRAWVAAQRGDLDHVTAALAEIARTYPDLTDRQFRVPVDEVRVWLARWSGDLSDLPESLFSIDAGSAVGVLAPMTKSYRAVAVALAADTRSRGVELVSDEVVLGWRTASRHGTERGRAAALALTIDAEASRWAGDFDPMLWDAAVAAWETGTYRRAVTVLGWARAIGAGRLHERAQWMTEAVDTARRLRAVSLSVALEGVATR